MIINRATSHWPYLSFFYTIQVVTAFNMFALLWNLEEYKFETHYIILFAVTIYHFYTVSLMYITCLISSETSSNLPRTAYVSLNVSLIRLDVLSCLSNLDLVFNCLAKSTSWSKFWFETINLEKDDKKKSLDWPRSKDIVCLIFTIESEKCQISKLIIILLFNQNRILFFTSLPVSGTQVRDYFQSGLQLTRRW